MMFIPINSSLKALFFVACAFGLSGCGNSDPHVLGFIGGLSGRVADLGVAGRNGVLMAVEERNLGGGIDGRQIHLEIRDDQQDEASALAGVADLLDQDVALIIGHMTSSMSVKTLPLMNEKQVLMLSPTATTQQLTGIDDYFIRVINDDAINARNNALYCYKNMGLRRMAVVYDTDNAAYTESWLSGFRDAFTEQGGQITKVIAFKSGDDVHFTPLAEQALLGDPDGVQLIVSGTDAALLIQQLRKMTPDLAIATSEWGATEKLIGLGGMAVEGVVTAQLFNRDDQTPGYLNFKRAFEQRFSQPPGFAEIAGYDAARVALSALAQQRDGESLKQTIIRLGSFPGAQGTIRIDRFGDSFRNSVITKVENGAFSVLQ
ncbi:MAG: branched-chain amino acid transport system substrate-binding protein [Motiliproteus sp.]|jgi:branched-chain amino acid transport system substrate-binding protein